MKVMVYERNEDVLNSMLDVWCLHVEGVVGISKREDALAYLDSHPLDLVVVSFNPNDNSDLSFLEQLKSYDCRVSAIIHEDEVEDLEKHLLSFEAIFKKPLLKEMFSFIEELKTQAS